MANGLLDKKTEDTQQTSPFESSSLFETNRSNLFGDIGEPLTPQPTEEQQRTEEAKGLLGEAEKVREIRGQEPTKAPLEAPSLFPKRFFETSLPNPTVPQPTQNPYNLDIDTVTVPGSQEKGIHPYDVVNFLFGGEMAILGMKYDNSGFLWDWEVAKQQWSEEPLWVNLLNTTSLVGTLAFPIARAGWASTKFGKIATTLLRGKGITKAMELEKFKALGLVESTEGIADKTLELLRRQEHYLSSYERLARRAEKMVEVPSNEMALTGMERYKYEFQKRFTNTYFDIVNARNTGRPEILQNFHNNINSLFKAEDLGILFRNMPEGGDEVGKKIYTHWIDRMSPGIVKRLPKLTAEEQRFADIAEGIGLDTQKKMLELGAIDEATVKKVGQMHVPALYKGTPMQDVSTLREFYAPIANKAGETRMHAINIPRIDSPTFNPRKADLPEVYRRLVNDELITDLPDLTMRGIVTDRLLANNLEIIRDLTTNSQYATKVEDLVQKFGPGNRGLALKEAQKAGYISLDRIGGRVPEIIRRMIKKADLSFLGVNGELPYIRKDVFDELFGTRGLFAQTQNAIGALEIATTIHKTVNTALNIPTHFQNTASNIAMLSQAGFNFMTTENLKLGNSMAKAFNKIAKAKRLAKEAGRDVHISELGVDLGKIKVGGKTFDLNEELLNPKVRELIEESAFELTEGFANLERLTKGLSEGQVFNKALAQSFIKAKKVLQFNDKDKFRWFDQMTKWYLGEDMVPKMTYYMALRGQGLTENAAILEVGRRLPMYQTVGSTVKWARKQVFPWATFPAEAVRITKNNMMDHPLRMIPWLQLPHIMQAVVSGLGYGPNSANLEESTRALPMWAQTSTTVVGQSGPMKKLGAGTTGGLVGGILGAGGGLPGTLAGMAAGAGLGVAAVNFLPDKEAEDRIRGAVLDWLPHASFFLTTTSKDFGGKGILPWRDIQGMMTQMPAEPLAILKPLLEVASGRTSFGQEVQAEDFGGVLGKSFAGLISFMVPPYIQKYGIKATTPDISISEYLTGKSAPGDITNISRLLTDVGSFNDAQTGKPGSFTNDFLLRNLSIWKSYPADPSMSMINESKQEMYERDVRNYLSKNLGFYLENAQDEFVVKALGKVMSSFSRQYANDPQKAQEEFTKWLQRRAKDIGRHPRLRNWSQKEIKDRLEEVSRYSGEVRSKVRQESVDFLSKQLEIYKNRRLGALKSKLFPGGEQVFPAGIPRLKLGGENF